MKITIIRTAFLVSWRVEKRIILCSIFRRSYETFFVRCLPKLVKVDIHTDRLRIEDSRSSRDDHQNHRDIGDAFSSRNDSEFQISPKPCSFMTATAKKLANKRLL